MTGRFVVENVPMPERPTPAPLPSPLWPSEQPASASGEAWGPGQVAGSHDAPLRLHGPEKVAAEPVTHPKKYARAKLESATDIGNEIARVYRLAKSGEMDSAIATKLTYILATLAKVRGDGELERRIEALETRRIN